MDEQKTSTQASNYDISADGAVNAGYDEEPITPKPEEPSQPEAKELAPDGVRLNDGEVEFGAEFFGDMKDEPEEATEPEAPKGYTDEELDRIPFQEWDISRLNGDVGKYARKVQEQLERTQVQASAQRWEKIPLPSDIAEVKPYTPQELNEEALKLACEKLGIGDVDDFDSCENEHQAAYQLAIQELIQRRQSEIAEYQAANQTWNENNRYQAELMQRPDFSEFNQWVDMQCRQRGTTIQQLNAGLYNTARQNGNNFRIVPQFIEGLYREFRQTKQSARPKQGRAVLPPMGIRRVPSKPSPAVLESSGGNNYAGKPSIRAEAFAGMNADEQADALMKLGLV